MSAGGHVLTDAELLARLEKAYQDGDRDGADLERASILMYLEERMGYFAERRQNAHVRILGDLFQALRSGRHLVGNNAELWR